VKVDETPPIVNVNTKQPVFEQQIPQHTEPVPVVATAISVAVTAAAPPEPSPKSVTTDSVPKPIAIEDELPLAKLPSPREA
jgi:hypothetical protein